MGVKPGEMLPSSNSQLIPSLGADTVVQIVPGGGTNRAARARTAVGLHYQLKEKFVRCWAEEELDEE
jgi:hypothetical protein